MIEFYFLGILAVLGIISSASEEYTVKTWTGWICFSFLSWLGLMFLYVVNNIIRNDGKGMD